MKTRTLLLLTLLNIFILPDGFAGQTNANEPAITNSLKAPLSDTDFNQYGYFTYRQDYRKCISPVCGGIFVKAVNRKLTRCADGSLKAECYVASVNNRKNIDSGSAVLLQGQIKAKTYRGFGNLGVFELKTAFSSATDAVGEGLFVGLEDNAIRCITTPCFSADQYLLNRKKLRVISGIDLGHAGASEEILNKALATMADGSVLIAAGVNKQVKEVAGAGITFVASQFYLPIEPEPNKQ